MFTCQSVKLVWLGKGGQEGGDKERTQTGLTITDPNFKHIFFPLRQHAVTGASLH